MRAEWTSIHGSPVASTTSTISPRMTSSANTVLSVVEIGTCTGSGARRSFADFCEVALVCTQTIKCLDRHVRSDSAWGIRRVMKVAAENEEETLWLMQHVWALVHALDVRSKQMERTLGVTGPQRLVIRAVGRNPDATAKQIAQDLGLHPSTLTGVLSRLEERGMLERRDDAADGRRRRFRLTARGRVVDRRRTGTVEAAVSRSIQRGSASMLQMTARMLALLVTELERPS
jgi:DNA-binding MarR family transcriptional regulator